MRFYKEWKTKRDSRIFAEKYKVHTEFMDRVRTSFTSGFMKDPTLIDAYSKQSRILQKSDNRTVIAVFVDEGTYIQVLKSCINPIDKVDTIVTTVKATGEPIGAIGDIPMYLSSLMSKAPVFVVGEIRWELNVG